MRKVNCLKTPNNFAIVPLLVLLVISIITYAHAADQFNIRVNLDEVRNEFSDDIEYHPTSLILNENNDICDTGNSCTYDISDGELTLNSYDSTLRSFDGTLKVIIQQGDTKVTRLFPFNAELSISEIRETGGKTVELLDGKIGLGKEAVHELGHVYGLLHCKNTRCVMHFSISLHYVDTKERSFCQSCRIIKPIF
jgi:hypothetical protein